MIKAKRLPFHRAAFCIVARRCGKPRQAGKDHLTLQPVPSDMDAVKRQVISVEKGENNTTDLGVVFHQLLIKISPTFKSERDDLKSLRSREQNGFYAVDFF
jgi:hypothetical protein